MQLSVKERLEALRDQKDQIIFDFDDVQLLDSDGQPLTARSWSRITKEMQQGIIRIKAEWIGGGDASSTDESVTTSIGYSSYTKSPSHNEASSIGRANNNDEFFGIRKVTVQDPTIGMQIYANVSMSPHLDRINFHINEFAQKIHSPFPTFIQRFHHFLGGVF